MEEHTVVAVDVAKDVFEVAVSEEPGRVKLHRRLLRREFEVEALAEQTPAVERLRSVPGIGLMTSTALVA